MTNKRSIKIATAILVLLCTTNCVRRAQQNVSERTETTIEKAIVFYDSHTAPWGVLKVADTSVEDFFKYDSNWDRIVLTDIHSLKPISEAVRRARPTRNGSVDTAIAVLLFFGDRIDTLATDAFPQYPVQLNNTLFYDSELVFYLIDLIRNNNRVWDKVAKEYYFDGAYHHLPYDVYKKIGEKINPTGL